MIDSLVKPEIKRNSIYLNNPEWSTDQKLTALEYLSLEKTIEELGNISLDEYSLEFLDNKGYLGQITDLIRREKRATIDLASRVIAISDKCTIAQAYIHQEVKKALKELGSFEMYFDDHDKVFSHNYDPKTIEEIVSQPIDTEYHQAFEAVLKMTGPGQFRDKILKDWDGLESEKEITKSEHFQRLCRMHNYNINDSQNDKRNLLRKLFNHNARHVKRLIFEADFGDYETLNPEEKKEINRYIVGNLAGLGTIQLTHQLLPFTVDEQKTFGHYVKKAVEYSNFVQGHVSALVPVNEVFGLLPMLKFGLERIEEKRGENFEHTKYWDYSVGGSFFDFFPFEPGETNEMVLAAHQNLFPEGQPIYEYHLNGPITFYLGVNGELASYYLDREALRVLDLPGKDEPDPLMESLLEPFLSFLPKMNAEELEEEEQRQREHYEKHGYQFTTDNHLPIKKLDLEAVEAMSVFITSIREELDKQKLVAQMTHLALGNENYILVEESHSDSEKVYKPWEYLRDSNFISNGMIFVGKRIDDYCKALGEIPENASEDVIKRTYRKIVYGTHPDLNPKNLELAKVRYIKATEAKDALLKMRKSGIQGTVSNPYIGRLTDNLPGKEIS